MEIETTDYVAELRRIASDLMSLQPKRAASVGAYDGQLLKEAAAAMERLINERDTQAKDATPCPDSSSPAETTNGS